jgi:haloalkane dehalogenase
MNTDSRNTGWRDEYPFRSHYLSLPAGRLHYVDEGPTDTAPIVCIHGNPTWSFYYRAIVSHFSGDRRCLALDHLGCGLSDKPKDFDYCLANHTSHLVNWLDQLDLRKVTLVVHDWGGAIGLGAAVQRLDRISKLLILNTAAFPPPYIPFRINLCRIPWLGSWAMRYLNAFARAATWMAIDRLPRLSNSARDGLLFPYSTVADRIAIDRFVKDIPASPSHRTWPVVAKLETDLDKLSNKPTTFVWGMKDWCFVPGCMTKMKPHFPDAEFIELSDVGHYVMEEAPREVIDALSKLLDR